MHRASWVHWMKETPRRSDGEKVSKVDVHDLLASADCQKQEMRVGPQVGGDGVGLLIEAGSSRECMVSMMHSSV